MRKNIFGKQLGRDFNERKALFKALASSLVLSERIRTTEGKAKAVRSYIEKLVTKARKGGLQGERLIEPYLTKEAASKMFLDIAPRFVDRPGGYTRIIHAGNRIADNAEVVMMEWVEKSTGKTIVKKDKKNEKKVVKAKDEMKLEKKVAVAKKKIVKKQKVKKA